MPVAGLDVHKKVVEACVLDEQGKVQTRMRFGCTRENVQAFAKQSLGAQCRVALEATTNTWAIVDILTPLVAEVVVSNPLRTRAIAEAKVKTDKIDAQVLAELLFCDYLPRVWQPDAHTRLLRHLSARRAGLVAERTRIKNRLHAVFHQRLIVPPKGDLFGKTGVHWLKTVDLDAPGRAAVDSEMRLLELCEQEIAQLTATLFTLGGGDPRVKLLVTLPGVDVAVAQTLLACLGDVSRFADADHAASYLGLSPSTHQSAEHCYHGPITKRGKGHARWMMVQAAQHLDRHPGPLGVFFRHLVTKKDRNIAVVAAARKLVVIAYHMLSRNEPYRYAEPAPTQAKLSRLRVRAGGKRRRTGLPKGSPRPDTYGHGRTRAVPALADLYEQEGLPSLPAPRPGEARLIAQSEILRMHLQDISATKRKPRGGGKLKLAPLAP
jgi:transposase